MLSIGLDIGSSFIKGALWDSETESVLAHTTFPGHEIPIQSSKPGWAEQDPSTWWEYAQVVIKKLIATTPSAKYNVEAIGISYQMHGLVLLDHEKNVIRPSIIWCDSRASQNGEYLAQQLGPDALETEILNHPGNFTVSKLHWVLQNEPDLAKRIRWVLLPGDFIAYQLTGHLTTTPGGLSEGMFWDFKTHSLHQKIVEYTGASADWFPEVVENTLEHQEKLIIRPDLASELGLAQDAILSFRGGDQPVNAFALGVEKPGVWAASAGTSGVLYRIEEKITADPTGITNRFAHVNYSAKNPRMGSLFCLNGTGIAYSWMKNQFFPTVDYSDLNLMAESAPVGSNEALFYPFGNGGERMFHNRMIGAGWRNLEFNRHEKAHLIRSLIEGIAFSFAYAVEKMDSNLSITSRIRAPKSGLFKSKLFASTLATLTQSVIEYHAADGASGAAKGAARVVEFGSLEIESSEVGKQETIEPDKIQQNDLKQAFETWKQNLPLM